MTTRQRRKREAPPLRPASQRRVSLATGVARVRRVLVASDGSKASVAAIRFARLMEEAGVWVPEALTVVEHLPVAVADVMLPPSAILTDPALIEGAVADVRRIVHRHGGAGWPFRSDVGSAHQLIADYGKLHATEVIVVGFGRHGKLARLFGAETVARVCRHSDVPVFAVDAHLKRRPRSIVVAMDFGASSIRAASEAVALLEPGGRLHLVHVRWAFGGQAVRDPAWERTYALGVEQGFLKLAQELESPAVTVTSEFRLGGILENLLEATKERSAEVIAVGSHSQNLVDRVLLGSTAAMLLRASKVSVLVAPPRHD
jgi:nucleotide-binding universal stress UspA family protein